METIAPREYTKGLLAHDPTPTDRPGRAAAQEREADRWRPVARGGHEAWLLRGLELPFRLMKCSRIQQVMVAQFCEHAKKHYSVHFKRVNSMAWEFHLNEAIKATKKTTQEAVDSPPS